MANLLWLSISFNRRALKRFSEFIELGRSLGHEISPIEAGTVEKVASFDSMLAQITNADGYIVSDPGFYGAGDYTKKFTEELQKGVRNGKRLLVLGDAGWLNFLTEGNSFLLPFDMAITTDKIFMPDSPTGDERLLRLTPKEQTYAWDSPLLKNVEEIVILAPQRLWYGKDAGPFLICPPGVELVDSSDYLKVGPREPACAGIWPLSEEDGRRVVVLAGDVVHNSYGGITGQAWPGITRNGTFARNLVTWLANVQPRPSVVSQSHEAATVNAIEVALHDVVLALIKKEFGANWWTKGVPQSIRTEVVSRREREDRAAPEDAYFYLIDLKEIILKQWPLFAECFESPGKSKADSLGWFNRLNEIRNRTAHPLKLRHLPLNSGEIQFLEERLRFVQDVAAKCGVTVENTRPNR
jgi:hypothetical protein